MLAQESPIDPPLRPRPYSYLAGPTMTPRSSAQFGPDGPEAPDSSDSLPSAIYSPPCGPEFYSSASA